MSPIISTLANASAYGYRSLAAAGGGPSFESIASANGNGSATEVTFSSIPSTFQSLQIRIYSKVVDTGANNGRGFNIYFNGSTSSEYAYHILRGTGSAIATETSPSFPGIGIFVYGSAQAVSGTPHGAAIIDIHNYTSTTQYKTLRAIGGAELNATGGRMAVSSGLWQNTAAISSVRIVSNAGEFTSSTQFSLYGIKGA